MRKFLFLALLSAWLAWPGQAKACHAVAFSSYSTYAIQVPFVQTYSFAVAPVCYQPVAVCAPVAVQAYVPMVQSYAMPSYQRSFAVQSYAVQNVVVRQRVQVVKQVNVVKQVQVQKVVKVQKVKQVQAVKVRQRSVNVNVQKSRTVVR